MATPGTPQLPRIAITWPAPINSSRQIPCRHEDTTAASERRKPYLSTDRGYRPFNAQREIKA